MLKRFILACSFTLLLLFAVGCQSGSSEVPQTPLNIYYEALLSGNYGAAYSQLCKADQAVVSSDDFNTWQTLYKQTEEIKSFKLSAGKEVDSFKDPFGNRYARAVEFTITQTDYVHQTKSDNTYEYTRTVVFEDGKWKICRGEAADIYQHRLYYGYSTLGQMYAEGKNVDPDPAKALSYFTSALEYNESDMNLYFQTALLNLNAKQPEAAEELCRRALAKQPEAVTASEIQNLMGVALAMLDRKDEAKKAFEEAVKLNPENQNAAGNLKNILK